MAILRSVVDVNNGNTGWTKQDVLDALETVFANLGFNGGTTRSGVPQVCVSPTGSIAYGDGWSTAARNLGSVGYTRWYYDAISQGTASYRMLKKNFLATYTSGGPNSETDEISFSWNHGLTTGDPIHWAPGETEATKNINGLSLDTVYYVIVVDSNTIKLAANATDATNGVAIDLLYGNIWTDSAALGSELSYFRDIDDAQFDNRTIQIATGDQVYFEVDDTSGGDFSLCGGTDNYDATKLLSDSNFRSSYAGTSSAGLASTSNITSGTLSWSTYYWRQTENERDVPDEQIPLAYRSLTDNYGIKKYIYASDTHATMKGEIVISPKNTNNTGWDPYWKVTIPANGGRSELKLRVYRDETSNDFHPQYVKITSIGTGWTEGETFTIPGDQTGGFTPADDINFGIRSPETSTGADDGVCQLYVTTLGSGSNFYQKSEYGAFAVLKVVNDAAKDYGTSYYSFSTANWSDSYMYINSGNHWEWMNIWGTNSTSSNAGVGYGEFGGVDGLDCSSTGNYANRANDNSFNRITIASTSTPTAYPMSIRVYRAQAPQDTNFAVIQFCQTINGSIVPYGQFTIHKGATFGSNVWDFDHVFLGTYTQYTTSSRSIHMYYTHPGYSANNVARPSEEPVNSYSVARESSYGYRRDPDYGGSFESQYSCNIDTNNDESGDSQIMTYYRNSTYDQRLGYSVDAAADYYKPIKGLPLAHNVVPCPYYLPDDFVMLQFSTTPGATVFRPGDTVTVSPSEVYEVILAGYQTSQNGLDNVENNSSMGMLFLARTT
jgi:hypothetical protein